MGSTIHRKVGKSAAQKLSYVCRSWGLKGTDFGVYLRRNGIRSYDLENWTKQMIEGLQGNMMLNVETKNSYQKKIVKLEKELKEARAIIEAQKKMKEFMKGVEQKTDSKPAKPRSK